MHDTTELDAFLALLGSDGPDSDSRICRLQVILDAIEDEEWMANLRHWHDQCHHAPKTLIWKDERLLNGEDPATPEKEKP